MALNLVLDSWLCPSRPGRPALHRTISQHGLAGWQHRNAGSATTDGIGMDRVSSLSAQSGDSGPSQPAMRRRRARTNHRDGTLLSTPTRWRTPTGRAMSQKANIDESNLWAAAQRKRQAQVRCLAMANWRFQSGGKRDPGVHSSSGLHGADAGSRDGQEGWLLCDPDTETGGSPSQKPGTQEPSAMTIVCRGRELSAATATLKQLFAPPWVTRLRVVDPRPGTCAVEQP